MKHFLFGIAAVMIGLVQPSLASENMVTTASCMYSNIGGYRMDVTVQESLVSNLIIATIQQSSLTAIYGPQHFVIDSRTENSKILAYRGNGFSLQVDLESGLESLPPHYRSMVKATNVRGGKETKLYCTIQ